MDLCKHIFHISCTLKCCPLSHYHKVELPQSFSHLKKKTSSFFWLRRGLRLGRAFHQGNKCPIASIPGNWNVFLGCFGESTRYKYVFMSVFNSPSCFLFNVFYDSPWCFMIGFFKIHPDVLCFRLFRGTLTHRKRQSRKALWCCSIVLFLR